MVGHSWGGTVITEAGNNDKVKAKALVYVAALAPDPGQSSSDLGKSYPSLPWQKAVKTDTAGFLYLTPDTVRTEFAQDLPASEIRVMAVTQGPISGKAFADKVTNAAWKNKPSYYVVADHDRMIQPEEQRDFAKKIKADVTTLPSSHVPMLSHPEKVADVIIKASLANK